MTRIAAASLLLCGAIAGTLALTPTTSGTARAPRETLPKRAHAARGAMSVHPTVRPRSGGRRTVFVIRFVGHAQLGRQNGRVVAYELGAFEGNRHSVVGCTGSFDDLVSHGLPGHSIEFREAPDVGSGIYTSGWCPSRYQATIKLTWTCTQITPRCRRASKQVVGHASWLVVRHD